MSEPESLTLGGVSKRYRQGEATLDVLNGVDLASKRAKSLR